MKIAITAATSQLGQLVIQSLLSRGVKASNITAVVRNLSKAAPLSAQGIDVRQADYNDSDAFVQALEGVNRVLLISGLDSNRAEQHRNIAHAAREAGVGLLAYTSVTRADTSRLIVAADHKATEAAIRDTGVPHVILRNGWYIENYTATLSQALERGEILRSTGEGRVSGATRADYAHAAAAVLTGEGHESKVYELAGDESFTLTDFADEISRQSGTSVVYRDLPLQEYIRALVESGMPEGFASFVADGDRGVAEGELFVESSELSRLIGRPTTTLAEAIAKTLQELPQAVK